MEKNVLVAAIVAHTSLWHNNKHYPVGAEIALTEEEFNGLAYYLTRKETQTSEAVADNKPTNVADDTPQAPSEPQELPVSEEESAQQTTPAEKKAKGKKAE